MPKAVNLIFPHQLFEKSPLLENGNETYLIEEYLFFQQYNFHKQKICFHRASMKYYEAFLKKNKILVHYIASKSDQSDIRKFSQEIKEKGITKIVVIDPTDYLLEKRIRKITDGIELEIYDNPQFLNTTEDLSTFFNPDKKSFFQTTFYKQQRKERNILMDGDKPKGEKWTFDKENRKKYPKGKKPPTVLYPKPSKNWKEAIHYVEEKFSANIGSLNQAQYYPITHTEAQQWFKQFLTFRFHDFGAYEDAILKEHITLNHSVLSPLLNTGLLSTKYVVSESLIFAEKEDIPINSTEGFIRQIIGWREFIRGMYQCKGTYSRTTNFWKFDRKIPASFYDGTTGIEPIDDTIKKVIQTGYCHHIERLMILGNFMLLCEFHPDEVYQWFMELFIDAYDWVMVPNIYGMSQFSDGGTFATKPYISGSNYIHKMSNYKRGNWEEIWDGLFWRFIDKQQVFFKSNPRLSMMVHLCNKMESEKKKKHLAIANNFLSTLT